MSETPETEYDAPRPPAPSAPAGPPPHRAEPLLTDLTDAEFEAFHRTSERAFLEETPPAHLALEHAVTDPRRFFGMTVGGRWVATFGSFERRLTVPGGAAVPVSAVTAVTVHTAYRRRGLLRRMMGHEFDRCRERGEAIAALYASESGIYGRFGYGNAASEVKLSGSIADLGLRPDVRALLEAAGGSVDEVGLGAYLAAARDVHARLVASRPGMLDRSDGWWALTLSDPPALRAGAGALRYVLSYDDAGRVDGHAAYAVHPGESADGNPSGRARIREIEGVSAAAGARLWRYVGSLDLVRTFTVDRVPSDGGPQYLLTEPRRLITRRLDALYLRLLDVPKALAARSYAGPIDTVIEVRDDALPDAGGRFEVTGSQAGAQVSRTDRAPDLTLAARDLATAYLGETSLAALQAAGLVVEHRGGAVARAAAAFSWPVAPFCADPF